MGTHMKTTIDVADRLLLEAKRVAAREGTTLRALVEAGLREQLARRKAPAPRFVLRRASVGGQGVRPDLRDAGWDRLRDLAYEGRST